MASNFFDRLVARIDKLDPESLQAQMVRLARERGFLETIFQSIQEGVFVIDDEGKLLYANKAAEQFTGLKLEQHRGRSILRTLQEWDWEHLLEFSDVGNDWNRMLTREVEVRYPEHRFLSVYAVPLQNGDDGEKNILVLLRDVTRDRKEEATTLESERVNAIKLLAAGVAHEIGNPLNALSIQLQLLNRQMKSLPEEMRSKLQERMRIAQTEVARLDTIITQFLKAIRPSKPVLRPEQPEEVLQEALALIKTQCENRKISVSVEIKNKIPTVMLDRSQMKQVFFNLFKNALEAMPVGGSLKIIFRVGDIFVDISIIDSGKGIHADEMGRVFDPYHTTKSSGNGLGLMIVRRIIEDHGGEIELTSKEGSGTCFKIRLPRTERRVRRITHLHKPEIGSVN